MARKKSDCSRRREGGQSDRDHHGYGGDGYWDVAGHDDRRGQSYPSMTVPGAAAGYYAPYMYGSYGGRVQGYDRPPGYGPRWFNDPYHMFGHERNFMDKAADEVASWFGDEAAHMRREEDQRGNGPRNYRRSDARIEEDVNDRLTEDRLVDARDVTVTVSEREVTLDGHVPSRKAKRRAEDIADAVSGVMHVQNNLRVKDQSRVQA